MESINEELEKLLEQMNMPDNSRERSFCERVWNHQQEKIGKLEKEKEILLKAVNFYADKNNWIALAKSVSFTRIRKEDATTVFNRVKIGGKLARETLKQLEGEK